MSIDREEARKVLVECTLRAARDLRDVCRIAILEDDPHVLDLVDALDEALTALDDFASRLDRDEAGADLTRERVYRSDDRDLERCDNELVVFYGENGDWYVSVRRCGERIGTAVRITTSGTPRGCEWVPAAVRALYDALPPSEAERKP